MHTFEQIMTDLKRKIFKPIYFLMGDEGYFIDQITQYIEHHALQEEEKAFNQTIVYGKDINLPDLLATARRYPMMSNYNVVIVKEAQDIKGIDGAKSGEIDPMLLYAEKAPPSTILVINYKGDKLDKRKKLYKTLDEKAVLFESKQLYPNQVGKWIMNYTQDKGYTIDARTSEMMAEFLGADLSIIANQIEKLSVALPQGSTITPKEIEEHVGISKDFNVFELQSAIAKRDVYKANLIINHMAKNPKTNSIIPMISLLFGFFNKLLMAHSAGQIPKNQLAGLLGVNTFFIDEYLVAMRNYDKRRCIWAIAIMRDYDAKAKGIDSPPVDDGELMCEMIYKLLHI